MAQTIYYNKEYRHFIKEQVVTALLLWCVAIAGTLFAMYHHKNYSLSVVMVLASIYPIIELVLFRKAYYRIEISEKNCTFISNSHSITILLSDIESMITYKNNLSVMNFKHTARFLIINGCFMQVDSSEKMKFYIKWNRLFRNKQMTHEKILESFIHCVKERNKKFVVKCEKDCEIQ